MFVFDSIFVESTYSKANAPQPHEILVKSDSVTYTTDPAATLRVQSIDVSKVVTDQSFILVGRSSLDNTYRRHVVKATSVWTARTSDITASLVS